MTTETSTLSARPAKKAGPEVASVGRSQKNRVAEKPEIKPPSLARTGTEIDVQVEVGVAPGVSAVRKILDNSALSALVLSDLVLGNPEAMPVNDICAVLRERSARAAAGDLVSLQSMLAAQAIVLDGVFAQFARRAALAKTNDGVERMLRLALKAQSQSRATVESLAVIQQGPMIFAKQANIAQTGAQQQVNNGVGAPITAPPAPTPAEASASAPAPILARARARKS